MYAARRIHPRRTRDQRRIKLDPTEIVSESLFASVARARAARPAVHVAVIACSTIAAAVAALPRFCCGNAFSAECRKHSTTRVHAKSPTTTNRQPRFETFSKRAPSPSLNAVEAAHQQQYRYTMPYRTLVAPPRRRMILRLPRTAIAATSERNNQSTTHASVIDMLGTLRVRYGALYVMPAL